MNKLNRENSFGRGVRVSMQCLAVALPLLLLAHGPVHAASVCDSTRVSTLDQRLTVKADEGATPLRRFLERTRTIYQIDMTDAVQRVERHRQAVAACAAVVASR